ncbi:type I polyketide synthase [Mycobacterium sp. ACS4331]|uniref:type I polyketide synthase n=1 Tax=Mycobacterium sp. ACS4331 TaxID=1834121 RepID=UPI0007FD4134|nr:type I polyketide synthase [Mycobacterium sp. ACS4331]OBF13777.1 polyketide synthase [Mycobacterium sp. ACS4331]
MPVTDRSPSSHESLAIVGVGCRLPGDAHCAQSFWKLLCSAVDATGDVPETRWNAARYHDPNPAKIGKIVTRRGGFLDQIDQFDPQFFGISPREAHSLDPQQRLLLQVTWEALEDAGLPADTVAGTDVGVFIGGFTLDYQLLQNQGRTSRYRFKPHSATGMMMTMLANRISHAFDFRGPSMTIDTACSSSLVAVHLAAQSIWNGECSAAIAGGVNIMIGPNTAIAESKSGFLSPQGRSRAFDDAADGYARGEGGAVVVVKPLAQALRDGDDIYAQILGTAVSQDGHTDGITVPNEEAQEAAIRTALRRAGVEPIEVGYVEAHGTGTPVGDPIEMRALASALTGDRPSSTPLLIGSVKTNIGHLEAGAGVAGLIKAALVLKHGYIPANLHLRTPTRQVSLSDLKLDVPASGRPFPDCARRVAGVNSFGFGGTNAHVVLAEPPAAASAPVSAAATDSSESPTLLPVSARSAEALTATAGRLAEHLGRQPDISLTDLGYTLGQRRAHLPHRVALTVEHVEDARRQLEALAQDGQVATERVAAPKVAFVCTGMGPQWWGMCRDLLERFPVFADSIRRTDRELSRYADWSLLEELQRDESRSRMGETEIAQPANFAIQVALAEQLAHFGVTADAVIGHSAGEVAAHHLAGLLTFEQAVHVIHHRSRLQQRTTGRGEMIAVGLDAASLMQTIDEELRQQFDRGVSVAAINSPSSVTVAGDADVLAQLEQQLVRAEVFHRRLAVAVPYHTHHMESIKDELMAALAGLSSKTASSRLYSTVTGEVLDRYDAGAAYWWQNTRATVLFEPALRRMLDDGYTHFVELGPHPVLAASILETAGAQRVSVIAAQRRGHDDVRALLNCLGVLHCQGRDLDWTTLQPRAGARLLKLPGYPWQLKRFWNESHEAEETLHYKPVHPLLGQPVRGVHPTWEAEISTRSTQFLAGHRVQGSVVLPGAVYVEMALAAGRETYGSDLAVDNLVLHRAVLLNDTCDPVLRTTLNQDDGSVEFSAFTATADGDLKWMICATAELNTLARFPHRRVEHGDDAGPVTSMSGEEFYRRTENLGFDYGEAFRSVTSVTAGHDWAVADIAVPDAIADDLSQHRFHPALIDAAFQTLFGAPFSGQQGSDDPYLPTRIRHCAVYGPPAQKMTVHVSVAAAGPDAVDCDITVSDRSGVTLAVFDGFTVQSLRTSSRMSTEHIDKSLYELQWVEKQIIEQRAAFEKCAAPTEDDAASTAGWLVLADESGFGDAVADDLRGRGHHVEVVRHRGGPAPTPHEWNQRITDCALRAGSIAGIIDCWPVDMSPSRAASDDIGAHTVLRLVKALAADRTVAPRLFLVTANAQPAPGTDLTGLDQAAIWGLGRVIGHQEMAERWGGLIDVDDADDCHDTASRICAHVLSADAEDQLALRGATTFVPRLRPCQTLTNPFPTKLAADATYVVTGGTGALGRVVATLLAERGARHITLLARTALPPRGRWTELVKDHPQFAAVETIRTIERRGAQVDIASVDISDADQVRAWLSEHHRRGGREVRGIVHAAGSVRDQLLVSLTEQDYAQVVAPKITGTQVLHEVLRGQPLDFFVLFGSAGSTIAAPGQGNYAAGNAYLDAFAHHLRAQGLPALTIGWGPWSVGMVEELKLEKLYAQRGIELITPAVGARILDRMLNQNVAAVVAVSADWSRARHAGMGGRLPLMFADLDAGDSSDSDTAAETSILDVLAVTPEGERVTVVADQVQRMVAAVFDCAVGDIEPDDILDDIGLDSMMAMDFRVRINTVFSIDLPVLEILRGVSVNSLSARILAELHAIHGQAAPVAEDHAPTRGPDELDLLLEDLTEAELGELLAGIEDDAVGPERREPRS